MIPVILAGGSGTRFWPLSRREKPKQFLELFGDDRAMIEATVDRLVGLGEADHPVQIVCRSELVEPMSAILGDSRSVRFIEEPAARNTAPAIAFAAAKVEAHYGDEPLAFFPADHFVSGQPAFEKCLKFAAEQARDEAIITLGIPPTRPETGYGYIECMEPIDDLGAELRAEPVVRFVEKPDRQRALKYLDEGRFLWNSGIFVFRPSVLWSELQWQQPQMWKEVDRIRTALDASDDRGDEVADAFSQMESISIDYAVMEGAERVEVIPALFRWSDVGHWAALDEVFETDDAGNVVDADVILDEVRDSVIFSHESDRLIAASGLENMVIVDTADALLVIPRERAQKVRDIVASLKQRSREELL